MSPGDQNLGPHSKHFTQCILSPASGQMYGHISASGRLCYAHLSPLCLDHTGPFSQWLHIKLLSSRPEYLVGKNFATFFLKLIFLVLAWYKVSGKKGGKKEEEGEVP